MKQKVVVLQAPASLSANTNGSSVTVHTQKIATRRKATMYVLVGSVSGTSPTMTVKLQGSNDGSTWADIADSTTETISAAGTYTKEVDITRPYVRSVCTLGGTSPVFVASAFLVSDKLV
jgi:hypothetical protein